MPPKNKGKKGKKGDDEDFWEKAGESVASKLKDVSLDDEPVPGPARKSAFGGFAALSMTADAPEEDEDEEQGGLMSLMKVAKSKKDKKKNKRDAVTFEDGPAPGEGSEGEEQAAKGDISKSKKAVEMTAEELADEEWGPSSTKDKKGKKGKKGKKNAAAALDEDLDDTPATEPVVEPPETVEVETKKGPAEMTAEELADEEFGPIKPKGKKGKKGAAKEEPAASPAPAAETAAVEEEDEEDQPTTKVLSKKEKEKLKKEREKAKKKAAAAAAKGQDAPETPPTPAPAPEKEAEDDDDDAGAAEGTSASKKKKKKKKKAGAKKEEEAPAPAAAADKGKKKPTGALAVLRAAMEEKKRLEEEAKKREEEERKRIEEEERKAAEEEKRKEEEKQRRKEKEKAKREQARKEGRLLTDKQKREKAAAEIRRKALLESGMIVEGLQHNGAPSGIPSGPPKKVTYGSRKKKGPVDKASTRATESPEPSVVSPSVTTPSLPADDEITSPIAEKEDVKSDWDAESDHEVKAPVPTPAAKADDGVKSDWDASSDDEAAKPAPTPAATPSKATNGKNGTAATPKATAARSKSPTPLKPSLKPGAKAAPSPAPKAAPGSAKKTPVKEESESESESEEEDSEEDSDSDDSDEDSSDDDGMTTAQRLQAQRKAEAVERRKKAYEAAVAARNKDDLRSPICCILGHVDTGKTKLLDKIRQTNVQEGEAGGITQQIGATYFPVDAIKQKTQVVNTAGTQEYKIPGLLIIDTPGHESFTNLRSRGSSLCNIAILVVDIMHYLEPQTLESLRLLRDRKTPFIVALNKIDRIYGWEATPDNGFQDSLAKQKPAVQREFADRVQKTILAFAEQGLNSVLYYENKNFARNVSLVPTSAITGEGVPDMIMLLVNLTQQRMSESLMYLSTLECTVLEVKVIEGLGTTIDVVLSNGILHEGDKIVVCGLNGPIITQVRALLTPQPLRELRIKSQYVHHKEVKAALGVKIAAPDLEKAIAGSRLLVCGPDDDEEELAEEVMSDLTSLMESIDKSGRGVCVQASTLGSLEALLDFLKVSKIPVSGIDIGPVHKKNIRRAATMLEKAKELACILCFDVPVDKEAEKLAEEEGIKLFKADIIYHLFDAFTAYNAEITEAKRKDAAPQAVWPCRLKTIAVFAKRDPIILGVDILDGTLRVGTPLCVVKVDPVTQKKEIIDLGKITSLEINHKSMELVKKSQAGGGVAVKIESAVYQSTKMFGRHFDDKDEIVSHITRQSIDVLKSSFKEDVSMEEWHLIKALKPRLNIQ